MLNVFFIFDSVSINNRQVVEFSCFLSDHEMKFTVGEIIVWSSAEFVISLTYKELNSL